MNVGGLRFGAADDRLLAALLEAARGSELTYDHVKSTLGPSPDPAARTRHLDVGRGAAAFARAREALRSWVPHTGIGATVEPAAQPVETGATVLVVLRAGPVFVIAPNRIVEVVDEPRRFGFAYGTLPGHPEVGEESFVVEHLDDDTVRATIRVRARPGTAAARGVAPLVRRLQEAAVDRYLRAIDEHVRGKVEP